MVLSLHKQPFVITHFQFITAHFVRHCALKMSCNRKWPTGNQMVTWPMTSRDSETERSNSWPQYA